ncbi:IcmX (IcmY) [Legionella geestiana]|uniref:IcmX (IcmY) n=1 Tax=Legionella geestiana TaxID=45065 RepID=A0A0W0TLZ5_9GAMM|nr:type IVB secretion system protein IcmX [Legionella geestiana]KTC96525.1 IcmX (IcmY) [Legionella geestiana]QBS12564.1 type IV secretion protein IcmX [Legionella geestiana]QDQ39720.1 type IV secretion protein IcmX [Legionella geestiana]STX54987.1 IcmX (IcmY) [Legionella geestiana]
MRFHRRLTLSAMLTLAAGSVFADDITDAAQQQTGDNTGKLVQYLQNLGTYFGYNIQTPAVSDASQLSDQLLNINSTAALQQYVYFTVLGATPVNALTQALANFAPSSLFSLNDKANATFDQNYNSGSGSQGALTISPLIDQPASPTPPEPVSQALLNIMGTPDYSFCLDGNNNYICGNNSDTNYLFQYKVSANVIGQVPSTYDFFSSKYINGFLSQVNGNALLGPMVYSNESTSENSGNQSGLNAENQMEVAQNFIRYVTGAVAPISLPSRTAYDNLYSQMISTDSSVSQATKVQAQATLANYLANLRVYAAQNSVAIGNLYYMLSRRLPQKISGTGAGSDLSAQTSQAMSEYNMSTWRLFNQQQPGTTTQWMNQINTASAATVQKEVAILLAEMNYQLYLNRVQQERLLLTETVLLLQNSKAAQPNAALGTSGSTSSSDDSASSGGNDNAPDD